MRHRLEKGIVSVALGVSMAFGMCPATVIAEEYAEQTTAESQQEATDDQEASTQESETYGTQADDSEAKPMADAQTHEGITFEAWTATDSLPTTAGNYYLVNDVTLSDSWNVPVGESKLDLNGKSIKKGEGAGTAAIELSTAAFLDLYDYEGTGTIQPSEGASVAYGVAVRNGGAFNMHAGTIKGFSTGVYVSVAVFEMSGGLITENGADEAEGSIGGGVYFAPEGISTFGLTGGEISKNKAGSGAGVYVPGNVVVNISGAPKVTGNTADGAARNLYFAKSGSAAAGFALTGKLDGGASIGVTKDMEEGVETAPVFTGGFGVSNPDTDPAAYFTSDDGTYIVAKTLLGEGYLVRGYNVKVAEGIEHGTVTVSKTKVAEGDAVTITVSAADGYKLDTLSVTDTEGKAVTVTESAFTMPASDVTVNATFKADNVHTVTFDANGGTGTMAPLGVTEGETATLPNNTFTRSGYIFSSWNTSRDGKGTRISNGAKVTVSSDVTLYAQWVKSTTAGTGTTSTASTTSKPTSTTTTLAKTADPSSVAAAAALVAGGAGVVLAGSRKKRN